MKAEACEWRESLGAYALGQLAEHERTGLEAHLEGCPQCREELEALRGVARAMPLADPNHFDSAPAPPAELAERVAARVAAERRRSRRRRRLRIGIPLAAATAAATAIVVLVLSAGGTDEPGRRVEFASLPPGVQIAATLQPHAYGTEIRMSVDGVASGALCRVGLRGRDGSLVPAGTFRYRYGEDEAVLSSALDLSNTRAVVVHVGPRAYSAPIRGAPSA